MSTIAAPASRGKDLTKGVLSLLGLIALVLVVPLLLIAFVGWPLPRSIPSVDELTTALGDRYVPDRFLVGALACVCWLIWAELVASVVVEGLALTRGRTAAAVPLARGTQRAAARLVAGVALLAALAASRGETPAAMRTLTPAPVTVSATSASVPDPDVVEAPAEVTTPTYTVEQRDTLWDISERCLGDPFRWTEIWQLNQHQTMVDGRPFADPDRIQPGWVLKLPADARTGDVVANVDSRPTPADVADAAPSPSAPDEPGAPRVEVLRPVEDAGSSRVEVLLPVEDPSTAPHGTSADH